MVSVDQILIFSIDQDEWPVTFSILVSGMCTWLIYHDIFIWTRFIAGNKYMYSKNRDEMFVLFIGRTILLVEVF